jgi:ribulose-5-phosphate 4-epimerase/fuculose-1-phosphate aldolase
MPANSINEREDKGMPDKQAMYLVPKKLLGDLSAEGLRHLKKRVVAANRAMGYWYQQMGRDCAGMTTGHVSARVPGTNTFVTKGRSPERDLMSEVTLQTLVQIDIASRRAFMRLGPTWRPSATRMRTTPYCAVSSG